MIRTEPKPDTAGLPAPDNNIETDPVRQMASAMCELAFAGQTVDRDALALKGFTAAEIDRHGVEARDLANHESIRRRMA